MAGWEHERDEVGAVESPLLRGLGGRGDLALAEAVELGRIGDHDREVIGVRDVPDKELLWKRYKSLFL